MMYHAEYSFFLTACQEMEKKKKKESYCHVILLHFCHHTPYPLFLMIGHDVTESTEIVIAEGNRDIGYFHSHLLSLPFCQQMLTHVFSLPVHWFLLLSPLHSSRLTSNKLQILLYNETKKNNTPTHRLSSRTRLT